MIYCLTLEAHNTPELEQWLLNLGAQSLVFETDSPLLKSYFTSTPNLDELKQNPHVKILSLDLVAETDWMKQSRESFKPILIGDHFRIVPKWLEIVPQDPRWNIRMNPGLAFGTGGHETTRLCARFIEKIVKEFSIHSLLDVGCGTGLLALMASLVGIEKVTALDHDPDCENCIQELLDDNQHLNPQPQFDYVIGSLDDPNITGRYDCVVANILLETIIELLPSFIQHLNKGGHLIVSGIPSTQVDEAAIQLTLGGLQIHSIQTEGSWVALHARLN